MNQEQKLNEAKVLMNLGRSFFWLMVYGLSQENGIDVKKRLDFIEPPKMPEDENDLLDIPVMFLSAMGMIDSVYANESKKILTDWLKSKRIKSITHEAFNDIFAESK